MPIKTLKTTSLLAGGVVIASWLVPYASSHAASLYPHRAATAKSYSIAPTVVTKSAPKKQDEVIKQEAVKISYSKQPIPRDVARPKTINIESRFTAISTLETAPESESLGMSALQPPSLISSTRPEIEPLPEMVSLPVQKLKEPALLKASLPAPANADEPSASPTLSAEASSEAYGIFDFLGDNMRGKEKIAHPTEEKIKQVAAIPTPKDTAPEPATELVATVTPVSAQMVVSAQSAPVTELDTEKKGYLDAETRRILARIPNGLDSSERQSSSKAEVNRYDPDLEGILSKKDDSEEIAEHEAIGVAIKVRRPKLNVSAELQEAYETISGGQPHRAIRIYKDILRQAPRQQDALFGLATTYHRHGELDKARPFYVRLLQINPEHRDGLANFLSLIAQDAPEEALSQLEYLAKNNPEFGPVAAQLGALYDALGRKEQALNALIHAVLLSPDSMAYKFNLAVLYDKYGMVSDATTLYNDLLQANRQGRELPTDARALQERVIFINSNRG